MTVDEYLDVASRRPWIYGGGPGGFRGHDCTLFAANWAHAYTGNDPAAGLRETYETRKEAEAMIDKEGGISMLVDRRLLETGWKRVQSPMDGDIGIVGFQLTATRRHSLPAIRRGALWVHADPKRLIAQRCDAWPIWRGCAQ